MADHIEPIYNEWRDTARTPTAGPFHYSAVFFVLAFMLHIRLWTFIAMVAAIVALAILNRVGYSPTVLVRVVRARLAGPRVKLVKSFGAKRRDK